jgi:bacterioferritin-associated ferredoxin
MDDDNLVICRCEEITKKEILEALENGHTDMNEIKRVTRAGMGLCQGNTCKRLVSRIIADFTGQGIGEVLPSSFRPPVRPIKIASLMAYPNSEVTPTKPTK